MGLLDLIDLLSVKTFLIIIAVLVVIIISLSVYLYYELKEEEFNPLIGAHHNLD